MVSHCVKTDPETAAISLLHKESLGILEGQRGRTHSSMNGANGLQTENSVLLSDTGLW